MLDRTLMLDRETDVIDSSTGNIKDHKYAKWIQPKINKQLILWYLSMLTKDILHNSIE